MFLDGKLRELARARQDLGLRIELSRRLVRLESAMARDGLRRGFDDVRLGIGLARWFFSRLAGR
ncbi:MAG TPA: hypothetical protein PKC79_15560 [Solidesulfovibrio magneticus]|nr:hypothetical protein [Solidesulfovibrio magneticus]